MNQASHFLDGSTIYGSTLKKSRELRTFEGGRLRVDVRNNHDYLPRADAEFAPKCADHCYNSGKHRSITNTICNVIYMYYFDKLRII